MWGKVPPKGNCCVHQFSFWTLEADVTSAGFVIGANSADKKSLMDTKLKTSPTQMESSSSVLRAERACGFQIGSLLVCVDSINIIQFKQLQYKVLVKFHGLVIHLNRIERQQFITVIRFKFQPFLL